MFGIGLPELAVIMIVGVIMLGPRRLPEYARQAGRFVRHVRNFAQAAQDGLRAELGPEFANLDLVGTDPRTAVRNYLLETVQTSDGHREPQKSTKVMQVDGAADAEGADTEQPEKLPVEQEPWDLAERLDPRQVVRSQIAGGEDVPRHDSA